MKRYGKEHKDWRARVIERDKLCVVCKNGPKYLNAHHLIPKNFKKYALDLDNGIALCPHCHTLGKNSAHKHPLWFVEWMRIHRRFQYILAMHRTRKDEI